MKPLGAAFPGSFVFLAYSKIGLSSCERSDVWGMLDAMRLYRRSRRNDLATIKLTRNRWAVMQNVPRAQMEVLKSGRRIMNRLYSGVARPRIAWALADKIPYTVLSWYLLHQALSNVDVTHTLWFQKEALALNGAENQAVKAMWGITACIQVLDRTENSFESQIVHRFLTSFRTIRRRS